MQPKLPRLPTILGLLLLVLGLAAGVILVQNRQLFGVKASPDQIPQQVKTTNITDKSFTVSWVTEGQTIGFVNYGTAESLGRVASDKSTSPSSTHYAVVDNLKPQTTYYFKIGSGKNTFGTDGGSYKIKTGPALSSVPQTDIVFGTVNNSLGQSVPHAIVYVTLPGSGTLSGLTDNKGKWTIPLSTARTLSLSSYTSYNLKTETLDILVQAGPQEVASAKVLTGSSRPVPQITLGKNHDFTKIPPVSEGELPKSELTLPQGGTATVSGEPQSGFSLDGQVSQTTGSATVKLASPKDKEKVNAQKPQFVGTGTPGTPFTIKIESLKTYSAQVKVDKNGNWSWSPPENLESGNHTATISWKDEKGQTKTIKQGFTVLAAGASSIPSFTASPSGSATSSAKASPSPSPTAKPKASPTPTATPSGRVSLPSTTSGMPVSGSLTPSLGIFIMGLVLLLVGLFLPKTKLPTK